MKTLINTPMKAIKTPNTSTNPTASNRKFDSVGPRPRTNKGGIKQVLIDNSPLNNASKK